MKKIERRSKYHIEKMSLLPLIDEELRQIQFDCNQFVFKIIPIDLKYSS